MIRKNRHTASRKRHFLLGLATAISIMSALWCESFVSMADATATVKVGSAKIREKADANSGVVGSTSQGKTITLKSEVADASGTAWYEVYIGSGTTGYIRADLVEKNNDGEVPQVTAVSMDNQSDAGAGAAASGGIEGATVQAENAMDAQYATVSVNCKVRSAPSTNDSIVESLATGTQVVVSGQSNGSSDNKVWYYVTFTGANGGEKSGFIRSDLLTLGDMVPMPEEAPAIEPEMPIEPETPVYSSDYELIYKEAEGEWYLIDNTTGGEYVDEYKLGQLLEAAQNRSDETSEDAKSLVKQRIAIVVLIVLVVLLIIAVVIMAVKLRDAYYADYEDDDEEEEEEEEDEEEEEETQPRRRRRAEEEEEEQPRRRRRAEEEEEEQPRRRRRAEEEEETSSRRRRRVEEETAKPAASTSAKRKAKNFLLDEEEFEFEFLNMDDKK